MTDLSAVAMALFSPQGRRNPYPLYAQLRDAAPVFRSPLGMWLVLRHDLVDEVLRSLAFRAPRGYRDPDDPAGPPRFDPHGRLTLHRRHWLLFESGAVHARLRKLLMSAFTGRAVQQLQARIESLVDECLCEPLRNGTLEVISELAYPLPATVICELLGMPAEDRDRNRRWAAAVSATVDPTCSDAQIAAAEAAMLEWDDYVRRLIVRRRARPQAGLINALLVAGADGERLSEDEVAATITLLFLAGHETTTGLIGNGLYALLSHPQQLARLRETPALLDNSIEEMLRYDSPVQFAARVAIEDATLDGTVIPAGVPVNLVLGSANRDPRRHHQPDTFDITRSQPRPLSFGAGAHFCLGAALARLEARVALQKLLAASAVLRPPPEMPEHRPLLTLRCFAALNVELR